MINEDIFDKEVSMCQEMYKKDKSCNWGKCKDCGVLLLLYKLHKGELIEDKDEVKNFKDEIFSN
ncbi:MAG: hypothetical protein KAT32_05230 [Candidatus Moranbacteria bacterium]|nr:hypothetical protein [Candidatus Moranbacteria bacterium]